VERSRRVDVGRHGGGDDLLQKLTADSAWAGGDVLWDAYLLYGSDARWDDAPTHLIHWGRTIVAARQSLRDDFAKLFTP